MSEEELIRKGVENLVKNLECILESDEYFEKAAKVVRRMVDRLQDEGFTREEALKIVSNIRLY
jgi:DNA-binding transcriptional regulator YhcF (GntR family)